jgi:ribosomal-protein-alanine N-acetyltransferase
MTSADVTRVAAIEAESFTSPWKASTFRTLLARPGAELWVLEDEDDGIIGYAVLWCILDEGELANIAIADAHRGRGLGARLLSTMMGIARERGVASLYLEVRVSNEKAAELYRRFGFENIGLRRNYYDSPREDAVLMRASLGK